MVYTQFGRQKETWEYNVADFCDRGGITRDSSIGLALDRLSDEEFQRLTAVCDPAEDNLMNVDEYSFTVNHGNVGSRGICYEF